MIYNVRLVVTMVQVGTNLWVNPAQVTQVHDCGARYVHTDRIHTCIITPGMENVSDWPLDRVLAVLENAGK